MRVPNICPRCQDSWIPNNLEPGAYPGALSRADNETEICSECGVAESIQSFTMGECTPVQNWPVLL